MCALDWTVSLDGPKRTRLYGNKLRQMRLTGTGGLGNPYGAGKLTQIGLDSPLCTCSSDFDHLNTNQEYSQELEQV